MFAEHPRAAQKMDRGKRDGYDRRFAPSVRPWFRKKYLDPKDEPKTENGSETNPEANTESDSETDSDRRRFLGRTQFFTTILGIW